MRALVLGFVFSALLAASAFACGPGGTTRGAPAVPPIAAALDSRLPAAKLSEEDLSRVRQLRAEVARRVAAGQQDEARDYEEQAMLLLGFRKAWLACGPGTFMWVPLNLGSPARSL